MLGGYGSGRRKIHALPAGYIDYQATTSQTRPFSWRVQNDRANHKNRDGVEERGSRRRILGWTACVEESVSF